MIKDIPEEAKQQAIKKGKEKYAEEHNKINLYGIKDLKAGFVEVMIGSKDGVMIRNLQQAIQNKNTLIGQFPQDYELWRLGQIDEQTGKGYGEPKLIINAGELVEPK